eukprot:gene3426-3751_t
MTVWLLFVSIISPDLKSLNYSDCHGSVVINQKTISVPKPGVDVLSPRVLELLALWDHVYEMRKERERREAIVNRKIELRTRNIKERDLTEDLHRMRRRLSTIDRSNAFPPLPVELKKYFKDLCEEQITKGEHLDVPRYETFFRRIDVDGDGMLSPKEFRLAFKRLHYKNTKEAWTRSDPELKGIVSEERFRTFLRRSGLQDNLTASDLRRLKEKLERKTSIGGDVQIDHEK